MRPGRYATDYAKSCHNSAPRRRLAHGEAIMIRYKYTGG